MSELESYATDGASPMRPPIEWNDRIRWKGGHLLRKPFGIEVPSISAVNGPAAISKIRFLCDIVLTAARRRSKFPPTSSASGRKRRHYPLLLADNRGCIFFSAGRHSLSRVTGVRTNGERSCRALGWRMGAGGASGLAAKPAVGPPPPQPGAQAAFARPPWGYGLGMEMRALGEKWTRASPTRARGRRVGADSRAGGDTMPAKSIVARQATLEVKPAGALDCRT